MGEAMPQESNRITLKRDVRDRFVLRVRNVHFNDHQKCDEHRGDSGRGADGNRARPTSPRRC
jgi:hypothetical protein